MVVACAAPLDKVSDMDFELPTCTLPKLTAEALTDKLPGEVGFDGELGLDGEVGAIFVPAQPKVNRMEKINKSIELHASSENRRAPNWNWRNLMGMHLFKFSSKGSMNRWLSRNRKGPLYLPQTRACAGRTKVRGTFKPIKRRASGCLVPRPLRKF